jgi:antitoxin component YwqK of YwqJK toxin-antitoxin module
MRKRAYSNGITEYYTDEYLVNGYYHREDGPAIIWYYGDGSIKQVNYYQNGKLHRLNAPAVICYNHNGTVCYEEYYLKDNLHRTDGPASIRYNGNIKEEKYFLSGKELNILEWMVMIGSQ